MTFDGALVSEQGITFAIAIVEENIFKNTYSYIEKVRNSFTTYFPNVPIILMSHNRKGRPMYNGRTDIVGLLVGMDFRNISWQRYNAG